MVCRDRNRLAMQSDILGGVRPRHPEHAVPFRGPLPFGDHPDAKGVFDIDSMQLIAMVKQMRDEGKFFGARNPRAPKCSSARPQSRSPSLSSGACIAWPRRSRPGVDFIQTQCIYNMEKFREFIRMANDMGLTEKSTSWRASPP
jgi:methylenetetrahydrofolate reductase (NADPH)